MGLVRNRRLAVAVAVVAALALSAGPSTASSAPAEELDQRWDVGIGGSYYPDTGSAVAVSFQPGRDAYLTQVEFALARWEDGRDSAFTIRLLDDDATGGGSRPGRELASVAFDADSWSTLPAAYPACDDCFLRLAGAHFPTPPVVQAHHTYWARLVPQRPAYAFAVLSEDASRPQQHGRLEDPRTGAYQGRMPTVFFRTYNRSQQPVQLRASPTLASVGLPRYRATLLSSGGAPVVARTVTMSDGSGPLCTATTDADGVASCTAVRVPSVDGYTASFAGDPDYAAGRATAGVSPLRARTDPAAAASASRQAGVSSARPPR